MRKILIILIFLIQGMAIASESERPANAARDEVYRSLLERKYEELDAKANSARSSSLRVADGQPALASLYAGVSGCLTSGCGNHLSGDEWRTRLDRLEEWTRLNPDSTTARIALATYYLEFGWAIRGQGYANTVNDGQMGAFKAYVTRAEAALVEIGDEGKACPGWYTSMLRVGRSLGWPRSRFDTLYKEARHAYPDYTPIYFEMATYLAPRWYGSTREFSNYVDEAVSVAPATLSAVLYARLNWLMFTRSMFENGQVKWDLMNSSFKALYEQYPHPWNVNNHAKFACLAGDRETLTSLKPLIASNVIMAAWSNESFFDYCQSL